MEGLPWTQAVSSHGVLGLNTTEKGNDGAAASIPLHLLTADAIRPFAFGSSSRLLHHDEPVRPWAAREKKSFSKLLPLGIWSQQWEEQLIHRPPAAHVENRNNSALSWCQSGERWGGVSCTPQRHHIANAVPGDCYVPANLAAVKEIRSAENILKFSRSFFLIPYYLRNTYWRNKNRFMKRSSCSNIYHIAGSNQSKETIRCPKQDRARYIMAHPYSEQRPLISPPSWDVYW